MALPSSTPLGIKKHVDLKVYMVKVEVKLHWSKKMTGVYFQDYDVGAPSF